MGWVIWTLAIGVAIAAAAFFVRRYLANRGARLVECADNKQVAAVSLSTRSAAIGGSLRLSQCSRWPEKQDCGRECLHQIERAPEDCLVRNIVTQWYADKTCAVCGTSLSHVDWFERKPGVVDEQGVTRSWAEIAPERVPEVLQHEQPVCFDCHVSMTFRRQHPELVVDNPWQPPAR